MLRLKPWDHWLRNIIPIVTWLIQLCQSGVLVSIFSFSINWGYSQRIVFLMYFYGVIHRHPSHPTSTPTRLMTRYGDQYFTIRGDLPIHNCAAFGFLAQMFLQGWVPNLCVLSFPTCQIFSSDLITLNHFEKCALSILVCNTWHMTLLWDMHCSSKILVSLWRWMNMPIHDSWQKWMSTIMITIVQLSTGWVLHAGSLSGLHPVCTHAWPSNIRLWKTESLRWVKNILTFERSGLRETCWKSTDFSICMCETRVGLREISTNYR